MMRNAVAIILSLMVSGCVQVEHGADTAGARAIAKIKGEMLLIYNHPQPDCRDLPGEAKVPHVAKTRILDVVQQAANTNAWQIANMKDRIVAIHQLSTTAPVSATSLPARFTFTGQIAYVPPVQPHYGYSGTWSLEIQEVLKVIQQTKLDAATLEAKWADLNGKYPKAALAALQYLDALIERNMTEDEVLMLYPKGTLVKKAALPKSGNGFALHLRDDLQTSILAPAATGGYGYWIRLDEAGRVVVSCFSRKRTADLSGKGIAIMPAPPP